ncbi:MAG: PAS domain-containing protein [Deltaproteobacteria bacterium]|nr:PAS domain-containing protein [Deltaproteobacteria bacterium]
MSALHDSPLGDLTWWESARSASAAPTVLLVEAAGSAHRVRGWLQGAPREPRPRTVRQPTVTVRWKLEPVGTVELARGLVKVRDFVAIVLEAGAADPAALGASVASLRAEARARTVPIIVVGGAAPIARTVRVPEEGEAICRVVAEAVDGTGDPTGSVELTALFQATDVPLVGVDVDGVILYTNAAAAAFVGCPASALLDRRADAVIPAELVASKRKTGPGSGRLDAVWTLADLGEQRAREHRLFHAQRLVALGELTSGICHDFNNLLTTVIGNLSDVVHGGGLPADAREAIEDALTAAVDGANLTRRLGAKPSTGKPRAVDLGETLGDFGRILRRVIRREIKLELDLEEDVSAVVDRSQLEGAVMNLVLNAQNAMAQGGTLALGVRRDGDRALVVVSDDGAGMDAETVARATEPFFTTRGDSGGTGLGLAMVADFVHRFRGHLRLDSEPGRGTTVTLDFPWVPESTPRTSMPTREGGRPAPDK